jgi:hypothetical protein
MSLYIAWDKSMTVVNAQGAVRGSGIFPLNPGAIHSFRVHAFDPSTTSERELGVTDGIVSLVIDPLVNDPVGLVADPL